MKFHLAAARQHTKLARKFGEEQKKQFEWRKIPIRIFIFFEREAKKVSLKIVFIPVFHSFLQNPSSINMKNVSRIPLVSFSHKKNIYRESTNSSMQLSVHSRRSMLSRLEKWLSRSIEGLNGSSFDFLSRLQLSND